MSAPVKFSDLYFGPPPDKEDDPVGFYAHHIAHYMHNVVEDVIEIGEWFLKAKAALPHGKFGELCRVVGLSTRSAQRYMAIASNKIITANATRVSALPTSVGALYELTRLPDDRLAEAIETGEVSAQTERNHAKALVRQAQREHQHEDRTGPRAPAQPGLPPIQGPSRWEVGPEPAVLLVEKLIRFAIGLGEPVVLETVIELAGHVGLEPSEVSEYVTQTQIQAGGPNASQFHAEVRAELDGEVAP